MNKGRFKSKRDDHDDNHRSNNYRNSNRNNNINHQRSYSTTNRGGIRNKFRNQQQQNYEYESQRSRTPMQRGAFNQKQRQDYNTQSENYEQSYYNNGAEFQVPRSYNNNQQQYNQRYNNIRYAAPRSRLINKERERQRFNQTYVAEDRFATKQREIMIGERGRPVRGKTLRLNNFKIKSAQESAVKKGIMPVKNPTGNPFQSSIKIPKDIDALRKLQVRVDLHKIGDAPRAFSERLIEAENPDVAMQIDSHSINRMKLCDRFLKIQNAQRAMHPLTLLLLNEKRGLVGAAAKVVPTEDGNNVQQKKDGPVLTKKEPKIYKANKLATKLNLRKQMFKNKKTLRAGAQTKYVFARKHQQQ